MPIVDYETRVSSRFNCPTPESASPSQKHRHQVATPHDARAPMASLDLIIGTRGVSAERTDRNQYGGHCPDTPVLLGAEQSRIYANGAAATGLSGKRVVATLAAAVAGASIALCGFGAVVGTMAAIGSLTSTWFNGLLAAEVTRWACGAALLGACMTTVNDWMDWSEAHNRFVALRDMSQMATRLRSGTTNTSDAALSAPTVAAGLASADWAIHQAALELEAARDEAKLPKAAPAAAATAAA